MKLIRHKNLFITVSVIRNQLLIIELEQNIIFKKIKTTKITFIFNNIKLIIIIIFNHINNCNVFAKTSQNVQN